MEQTLPEGWSNVKLDDIVDILDYLRVPVNTEEREKRLKNAQKMYPYYGATGQVGFIDNYIFEGEAILLGEDAAPFLDPYKPKAYIVSGKYWVNNHAHILRSNVGCNKLLCYQLNHIDYRNYVSGTTRLKLTQSSLKTISIKFPPLNEQKRLLSKIEELFSSLDKAENALNKTQKLLGQYKQSALKAAVTGELTKKWREYYQSELESGEQLLNNILKSRRKTWQGRGKYKEPQNVDISDSPELPEGWVWCRMEQISFVMGGLTKNSKRNDLLLKKPMLRVGNVYQNRLELDDIHEIGVNEKELPRVLLEYGDILIVEGNGSKSQIGRMAIWENQISDCIHQNHLIKARLLEKKLANYILIWFSSSQGRQLIEKIASSTSGLYTLNLSKIEDFLIPLPPLKEVEMIVEQNEKIFSVISKFENTCVAEKMRLSALRQSVLKQAFSGKLLRQDLTDEPAEELLKRIKAEKDLKRPIKLKKTALNNMNISQEICQ
jgi:type I restriction enzyme S subunit